MSGADPMVEVPLGVVLSMAAQLEHRGLTADSERLADYVLANFPLQPDALHLKGLAAAADGRNALAASLIESAIAHGLDQALYHRNISAIYERLGRLDKAVSAGRRAVALDPTDAQSYHNLTVAHARRLELDESIACARTPLCRGRISRWPKRCCCAASLPRAGANTSGAFVSLAPRRPCRRPTGRPGMGRRCRTARCCWWRTRVLAI